MTEPVPGAPEDVGTGHAARERSAHRGPLRIPAHASARERIHTVVVDEHEDLARLVAGRIAALIQEKRDAGQNAVLGLATGSTPIGVYRELIRMHRAGELSFKNVVTFNLDEYYPMAPDNIHSYHRFMWENLFSHVDIPHENVHVPRGDLPRDQVDDECLRYEAEIKRFGGIDFQILGIGKTGHIGFNEPGSGADSRTRLVHLDAVTRRDAAADFFGEEFVPKEAVTMGVATILEAREIALLATGEHKSGIIRRSVEGEINLEIAATFLQRHSNTTFYVDHAAGADLTRIATPWLLDEVEWTEDLKLRAVVWLSQQTKRAILKLTQRDYAEHGMSSLVARSGSPGAVNGEVFNALGAKIRGKSKLPKGKRTICFSPHPDDDVISMGGILRKFVENGNAMLVAYMTSGNIAVFDHDVRRYVDFLERLEQDRGMGRRSIDTLASRVYAFLDAKQPGDVDIPEVQDIKRIIRESEAVAGIEVMGLSRRNARFLNLPFYQTGKVKKDPIGPADVAIVRDLLIEYQPEIIFVAGDLSDPHGTHRMCKEAIDGALRELLGPGDELHASGRGALQAKPEVWLYRGAWQEWNVTDATWLVPMSQEELRLKIQAIFKHQSQKDSAPFPGQDDREFWQRVDARNKDTAALLDRLGLAEYFAMEAYVVQED
ncbi:MAG: glucosamine-6-phosphate deaminase [bacterium]